jgi:hypothetical protein
VGKTTAGMAEMLVELTGVPSAGSNNNDLKSFIVIKIHYKIWNSGILVVLSHFVVYIEQFLGTISSRNPKVSKLSIFNLNAGPATSYHT